MIREATLSDLPQFAKAASEFIVRTPFHLNIEDYLENVIGILGDTNSVVYTSGEGHAAVTLTPSFYDRSQVIGRVFTTWGKGGLECFRACEQWAKEHGAAFLIADSFIDPRITKFYERIGMTQTDHLYMKVL